MNDPTFQPHLPLDERFRQAEQFQLDLPPPTSAQPKPDEVAINDSCPHHKIFVYGCRYCDPR